MFPAEIRRRRIQSVRSNRWRWHLDRVFVKINGKIHYLAVDHEGEVLEAVVTMTRDRTAARRTVTPPLGNGAGSARVRGAFTRELRLARICPTAALQSHAGSPAVR